MDLERNGDRKKAKSAPVENYKLYIGGKWLPTSSGATLESVNPYTETVWAAVPDSGREDVDRAVLSAKQALREGPWSRANPAERASLMHRLATLLRRDAHELAAIETQDNGKLLKETLAQCRQLADWFEYFAGLADKIEGAVIPVSQRNHLVYTRREPIGVVAGIVPWNVPLLLLAGKLAPALAAGCTFIVKPSELASVSTLEFARRVDEAGFPPGVFNVVTGFGSAGAALVGHPGIDKVTFTGSSQTGAQIARGAAGQLTNVALELGGKSPNIVFKDADFESAAIGVASSIFSAAGQSCLAGSRLLVDAPIHDEMVNRLLTIAERVRLGDPASSETDIGPLISRKQRDEVNGFIKRALEAGAVMAHPRELDQPPGLFVEPTILIGVKNDMEIAQEEVFGPVLSVIPFTTEEEAVMLANDSRFGLAAAVWTTDIGRAHRVAHGLQAGTVWVNTYRQLASSVPFGGYKWSGWGRENGQDAIREFTETKAIWVDIGKQTG